MKRYEVFCKDRLTGLFWTVFVEAQDQSKLTDIFEYATMKTFGMDAIGVKEDPIWDGVSSFRKHGDVIQGLNF